MSPNVVNHLERQRNRFVKAKLLDAVAAYEYARGVAEEVEDFATLKDCFFDLLVFRPDEYDVPQTVRLILADIYDEIENLVQP